jgi:hypothetical protein
MAEAEINDPKLKTVAWRSGACYVCAAPLSPDENVIICERCVYLLETGDRFSVAEVANYLRARLGICGECEYETETKPSYSEEDHAYLICVLLSGADHEVLIAGLRRFIEWDKATLEEDRKSGEATADPAFFRYNRLLLRAARRYADTISRLR